MKKISLVIACFTAALTLNANTGFFGTTSLTADGTTTDVTSLSSFGSISNTGTFEIQGFDLNTFEDNSSEVTHMNLFWTVDGFANTHQIQLAVQPAKIGNDRNWVIASSTQDMLTNNGIGALALGAHTMTYYFEGYTNGVNTAGNIFLNNGGSNYSTSFTVVPEPGTYALLAGLFGLSFVAMRRRKA